MRLGWRSIGVVVVARRRVSLEFEHRHQRDPLLSLDTGRSCCWTDQTHLWADTLPSIKWRYQQSGAGSNVQDLSNIANQNRAACWPTCAPSLHSAGLCCGARRQPFLPRPGPAPVCNSELFSKRSREKCHTSPCFGTTCCHGARAVPGSPVLTASV